MDYTQEMMIVFNNARNRYTAMAGPMTKEQEELLDNALAFAVEQSYQEGFAKGIVARWTDKFAPKWIYVPRKMAYNGKPAD